MRGIPDDLPVAQQDRLRRLMTETQQLSRGVGDAAVRLYRDHLVGGGRVRPRIDVSVQLIERFAAHAAETAVLEEEDQPLARFGAGGIKRLEVGEGRQMFHVTVSL